MEFARAKYDAERNLFLVEGPAHLRRPLQAVPGGTYLRAQQCWRFPATPFTAQRIRHAVEDEVSELRMNSKFYEFVEIARNLRKRRPGMFVNAQPPLDAYAVDPWLHQLQALEFSKPLPAAMLAMAMGTGKSWVVVQLIRIRSHVNTLIIAPKSAVESGVWDTQFERHWLPNAGRVGVLSLFDGTVAQRTRNADTFMAEPYDHRVVVINYEAIWREPFASWARDRRWDLIVADESHRLRSAGSRVSKFAFLLGQRALYRLGLSGTPMPEGPLGVYGQYRFLDVGIFGSNHEKFLEKYARRGGYEGYEILGYRNKRHLKRRFHQIAFRVSSKVLDIPDPVELPNRYTHMGSEAAAVYRDIDRDLVAEVRGNVLTAANALTKILRLQEISSGYVWEGADKKRRRVTIDTAREDLLRDVLEDVRRREPLVIFHRWAYDAERIVAVCKEQRRSLAVLSGKKNELRIWQDGKRDVLAVQIQAGNEAVDFTRSSFVIYYSHTTSLKEYEQSRFRAHRPGQTRNVRFLHLLVRGSRDAAIYRALQEKRDVVDYLLKEMRDGKRDYQHR